MVRATRQMLMLSFIFHAEFTVGRVHGYMGKSIPQTSESRHVRATGRNTPSVVYQQAMFIRPGVLEQKVVSTGSLSGIFIRPPKNHHTYKPSSGGGDGCFLAGTTVRCGSEQGWQVY